MPDGPDRPCPHALVVILGTGFAGLGMAIRLQQSGIRDVLLLERGDSVGGTWRDNTYPGAACDIPSHLYSFSFELNPRWSRVYSRQPEIRAYLEHCTDRYGLRDRIRFGAEVVETRFDEGQTRWHIHTRDGRHFTARYLVTALGALKDPSYPDLPGLGRFDGPALHSARWDHDVDFTGKRVGVIGTGASAIQLVPELAKVASHLTVFQRTPPWVTPRNDRAYTEAEKRRFGRSTALMRLHRWRIYSWQEIRHPLVFGASSLVGSIVEWRLRRTIREHFPEPAQADALTPDYRLGCKRILPSDDWYPAIAHPHVDVDHTAIARIIPEGVELVDGRTVDFDVLVYCTGFDVCRPMGDTKTFGRGGVELGQWWGARPRAYLGITVPRFPNAFILLGPNTGLGHNSVIVMIEAQVEYVLQAIEHMEQRPQLATLEVDEAALERFMAALDHDLQGRVWQTGCSSWYLGAGGVNFTLWPSSTVDYIAKTRRFDPGIYRMRTYDEAEGAPSTPS